MWLEDRDDKLHNAYSIPLLRSRPRYVCFCTASGRVRTEPTMRTILRRKGCPSCVEIELLNAFPPPERMFLLVLYTCWYKDLHTVSAKAFCTTEGRDADRPQPFRVPFISSHISLFSNFTCEGVFFFFFLRQSSSKFFFFENLVVLV